MVCVTGRMDTMELANKVDPFFKNHADIFLRPNYVPFSPNKTCPTVNLDNV